MKSLFARIMKLSQPFRIDTEIYTDKMADSGRKVIRLAYEQARSRGHDQMGPEHVLLAISEIEQPIFDDVMRDLRVEPQEIKRMLETKLSRGGKTGSGTKVSDSLRRVFANSLKQAKGEGRTLIESIDMFVGVFVDGEGTASEIMKELGADGQEAVRAIERLRS
jgi:ATP-dependent Clp protease ATP-binding subunit ClpC